MKSCVRAGGHPEVSRFCADAGGLPVAAFSRLVLRCRQSAISIPCLRPNSTLVSRSEFVAVTFMRLVRSGARCSVYVCAVHISEGSVSCVPVHATCGRARVAVPLVMRIAGLSHERSSHDLCQRQRRVRHNALVASVRRRTQVSSSRRRPSPCLRGTTLPTR